MENEKNVLLEKYSSVGWAKVKKEFINFDYKPKLASIHLPEDVKKELEAQVLGGNSDGPPNKKAKLKGRNKQRPPPKGVGASAVANTNEVKLCSATINGRECGFGDRCYFEHDIKVVLAAKPPDMPGGCYTYSVRGKCDMGVMCRFAGSHITEEGENIVDEERLAKYQPTQNTLTRDLQNLLRKRMYNFDRSYAALTRLGIHFRDAGAIKTSTGDNTSTGGTDLVKTCGPITDEDVVKIRPCEKKEITFHDKLYLAPLTTVGNLPFRRVCKELGADITCGEMAVATNLLQGQQSEWALLKRHSSEDLFGVQLCGAFPDAMAKCAQMLEENCSVDFVDINCGCPIDLIYTKGEGAGLLRPRSRLESVVKAMDAVLACPVTVKMRTGIHDGKNVAHTLIPQLREWGAKLVTLHGRTREQRYTRSADWKYIKECAELARPMPLFGNGDVVSWEDYEMHKEAAGVDGIMIARGALMKPWIFTEIKERRHWDISSGERLDILRRFSNYGLEHWGSDTRGVETTRKFLLELLSFQHRYIPVGLLEELPQRINDRPPYYIGRDDLETMMGSANCDDWIQISEMLLGPVLDGFTFLPKHKANAYR